MGVEVNVDGSWGSLCDDTFGMAEANLVCKQMGFHLGAKEVVKGAGRDRTTPIWNLKCAGWEKCLGQCSLDQKTRCRPDQAESALALRNSAMEHLTAQTTVTRTSTGVLKGSQCVIQIKSTMAKTLAFWRCVTRECGELCVMTTSVRERQKCSAGCLGMMEMPQLTWSIK